MLPTTTVPFWPERAKVLNADQCPHGANTDGVLTPTLLQLLPKVWIVTLGMKLAAELRPLSILTCICIAAALCFSLIKTDYGIDTFLPIAPKQPQLLIDGSKELSGIVTMLATLVTGMFVAVALASGQFLKPTKRPSFGWLIVLTGFGSLAAASFFVAVHAQYALAESLVAGKLEIDVIGNIIGLQAWLTAGSGACATTLIVDGLLASGDREDLP